MTIWSEGNEQAMKIKEYIKKKYEKSSAVSLSRPEASAFCVPWPLRSGWLKEYGDIEITDDMHETLVASLLILVENGNNINTGRTKAAAKGLGIFGVDLPESTKAPKSEKQTRKELRRLSRRAKKAEKVKACQDRLEGKRYQPTESSVLSFAQSSGINPVSDDFLRSFEWKSVRMMALKKYGAVCQCCGASPKTGAVINVDHIKPRKIFPQLALDVDNLQVLCGDCNHGKGNWDMTDWRTAETISIEVNKGTS